MGSRKAFLLSGAANVPPFSALGAPNIAPPETEAVIRVDLAGAPLRSDERGLVISCPTSIGPGGDVKVRAGQLDLDELRFALLFWDCLDWPSNSIIRVESSGEAAFLESAGALRRSNAGFAGHGFGGHLLQAMHVGTYNAHEQSEPGRWSLGRGINSVAFPESDLEQGRGTLFRLHKAIPIPNKDVPLADILEFKHQRKAELLRLRHSLDDIYQRIAAAPDRALAETTEFEKLDAALADHAKVVRENKWPIRLTGLEAKLNLTTLSAGGSAFAAATAIGLPLLQAVALGSGAFAAASIGTGVRLRGAKPSATPFEYVTSIETEL